MAKEETIKVNSVSAKKGDKEVRVEVRAIENGFIIKKTKEYNDPKKGWQYETKEWFSKDDPLEITDKSLTDLIK